MLALLAVPEPTPIPSPIPTLVPTPDPTPSAGDAFAGMACCGTFTLVIVGLFVLGIALLVWVARDAKARGMDGAVLWMILVLFTSVFGLILYLFSRPTGQLIQCPRCGNKRLAASKICPHCKNE
ncbi:MAG TPA: PLDc N-terminal domain-containing protein [Thermoanaerobaculia bacterium]|jgi:hypothetical protein